MNPQKERLQGAHGSVRVKMIRVREGWAAVFPKQRGNTMGFLRSEYEGKLGFSLWHGNLDF